MSLHPELIWAQRSSVSEPEKNIVYLTINLPDIVESTLVFDLTSEGFTLKAKTGNAAKGIPEKEWAADVKFFAEIDVDLSQKSLTSRHLALVLRKKEHKLEFWPRLTKDKIKYLFIKTDFSKWVDEDEQDGEVEVPDQDMSGGAPGGPGGGGPGGFDPSMFAGMGGGGGGGGGFDPSMLAGLGGAGGGAGGAGGMDFAKMMAQMGGGAGGPGGFDMSSLGGGAGTGDDSDDDDEDGPPPLETAEDEVK